MTVLLLVVLAAISITAVAAQSDTNTSGSEVDDGDIAGALVASIVRRSGPRRVLFIGNSHTYTNGGIDWHIGRMAASEDPPRELTTDSQTISGATLSDHYELDSQGRIPFGEWDAVVIQGHIPRSNDPTAGDFLEYARLFDAIVRENGARTVFFMSWPHPDFRRVKLKDIVQAHRRIERETGAAIAPVAVAMQRVKRERPDIMMLSGDGVHASWPGSYLAASVIYATLFEKSPEGLSYTFGVSEDDAAYLQHIAWEVVTHWNEGS